MRLSNTGFKTIKLENLDSSCPAQEILLQTGQLVQYGSGIYAYDIIPYRLQRKVEEIIRSEFDRVGCIEVSLPILQQEEIWQSSGRWDKYVEDGVMFVVESDKQKYGLAPTAEEAIMKFAEKRLFTYKALPVTFYQIGPKFRDEIRNRGYLFRGKAFQMFDAYSYDKDEEGMRKKYLIMRQAYINAFRKMGLTVVPVAADSGAIGGSKSEEMMVVSPLGEDSILYDEETGKGFNEEVLQREDAYEYLEREYGIKDVSSLKKIKALEVGHIFQLGTKYSESMQILFQDNESKKKPFYMGCYGIGVSRVVGLLYENGLIKENEKPVGFALPENLAPFKLDLIVKNDLVEKAKEANKIYDELLIKGANVMIDDTENQIGVKIKNARVLGVPFIAIFGSKCENGKVELENIKTGEKKIIATSDLINLF